MTKAQHYLNDLVRTRLLSQFARDNGISYQHLHQIMRGTRPPSFNIIKRLARSIKVEDWYAEYE